MQIAPSILAADFGNLRRDVNTVKRCGVRWVHLDVMDGHFVPNITFGPNVVEALRGDSSMYLDCHLMIDNPREYAKSFVDAGAQCITIHVEAPENKTLETLQYIRRKGIHAGICLRPKTPLSAIEEFLPYADLVLVMTVEPGFGGQKLIPSALNKVRELVHLREKMKTQYLIQVDGGINASTAPLAVSAGSDVIVAGSAVFKDGKVRENLRDLRNSLNTLR